MRFSQVAAGALCALAARAEYFPDAENNNDAAPPAAESSATSLSKPVFTVSWPSLLVTSAKRQ